MISLRATSTKNDRLLPNQSLPPILSEANPAQKIAGRRRPALGEESNWSVISQLIQNVELYRKLKLHLSPQRLPAEVGYSTFQ